MINKEKYQHPRDGQLLGQLLETDAVNQLFNWCQSNMLDSVALYAYSASFLEITPSTMPQVYEMIEKASELFGVTEKPKCFITHCFDEKIELTGLFTPVILISDEYVNQSDKKCLYGTIASQIASVAIGHQKGIALSWIFENCSGLLPGIPAVALSALQALLNQWKRSRWFSCDRACLLAVDDYETVLKTLFDQNVPPEMLCNFGFDGKYNRYEEQYDMYTNASKTHEAANALNSFQRDTSWIPERYKELQLFYQSRLRESEGTESELVQVSR